MIGNLLLIVDNISLIAAPVGAVTTPILFGIFGRIYTKYQSKSDESAIGGRGGKA